MRPSAAHIGRVTRIALLLAIITTLLVSLWPGPDPPLRFEDSVGYIRWPEIRLPNGNVIPILRPPGYPVTLALIGHGIALSFVQTALSIAGFGLLGWALAGVPGVAVPAL